MIDAGLRSCLPSKSSGSRRITYFSGDFVKERLGGRPVGLAITHFPCATGESARAGCIFLVVGLLLDCRERQERPIRLQVRLSGDDVDTQGYGESEEEEDGE